MIIIWPALSSSPFTQFMKFHNFRFIIAPLIGALAMSCNAPKNDSMITDEDILPPQAEKIPHEISANGNTREDNYYWMKLSEEQKTELKDEQSHKVVDYLTRENTYLETKMKHTEALQEKLYNEIIGRIKQTDESVPYRDNGYWYYTRYQEGQEYPIYCRRKGSMEGAKKSS